MAAVADVARIEDRIDRVAAGGTEVDMGFGGVKFATLLELMEFSKLMAVSGAAVPVHLRGKPGTCLAICTKALRFGFDPFALAEHSYTMVKSTKVDGEWVDVETIAYDSFVIHAIIEAHGEVTGPLSPTYSGEGETRICTVSGKVGGVVLSVTSPTLGEIVKRIGRNDKGKLKGSPLWDSKPDQQLFYDTRRDWCRKFQPHILLGWYDRDELEEHRGPDRAKEINPKPDIAKRLTAGKGKRGFDADHVERETKPTEPEPATAAAVSGSAVPESPGTGATEPHSPSPQPSPPVLEQSKLLGNKQIGQPASSLSAQVPNSGFDSRDGGQDTEIAGEAHSSPTPPVGEGGPPSIFQQYVRHLVLGQSAREVARQHKTFFDRHVWPEEPALQAKFERIRALHLKALTGELTPDEWQKQTAEAVASS